MPRKNNLAWLEGNKRPLMVIAIVLTAIAVMTAWISRAFESHLRHDLDQTLRAVLEMNHTALDLWAREHERRAEFAAGSPDIVALAEKLLTLPRNRESLLRAQEEPRSSKFAWLYRMGGYQGFAIIAPGNNINLAAARDIHVGVEHVMSLQPGIMERLWNGETVVSHPMISNVPLPNERGELEEGRPTMFVAAPIREQNGKVIAILALRIDPAKEFFPLLQAARISESGESYLFDRNGTMLSESRFTTQLNELGLLEPGKSAVGRVLIRDPEVDLTQHESPTQPLHERPPTRMIRAASEGVAGADLDGYRDYRGVPVTGAWLWDPEMDMGMTVEQDVAEAYEPFYFFRSLLYGFALFITALLILLTLLSITGRRKLQKSQTRLQGMLDTLIDGVVVIDARGTIESVNPAVEKQFGYKAAELIGQNVSLLMPESDRQHHDSHLTNYHSSRAGVVGKGREIWARRKDGREFPAEIAISEMILGEQRHFTGIIRDITQFKQAEEQLNMLNDELSMMALVAQETDNAVIITDKDGYVLWVNRGFVTSSEYALEEVLGQRLGDLLTKTPDSDTQEVQNICAALHTGQKVATELLTHTRSGRPYWINMEVSPVFGHNDDLKKFIVLQRDITARHLMMQELQQAKETAEAASRSKSNFLAAMSHEIRTPMNGVIGMIDVLDRTRLDEHQHQLTTTIRDSAFALLGIIDDILDFSKIEAGKLDLEEIPARICDLVEGVGEILAPIARQKNVELILFCDPRLPLLKADPVRLRQILFNLAGNAVKFSGNRDTAGRVIVRADLAGTSTDGKRARLRLQVSDNGIGMSPEVQQRLFQPFVQAEESTTRRFGGTGLGLVICRRLVEMMGGTIELQSMEGQGTLFSVNIELEIEPAQSHSMPQELSGITALLTGLDEIGSAIMASYLSHAGARVFFDATLDGCSERIGNDLAGDDGLVVIIDNRRAREDAEALYHRLNGQSRTAVIPLVVITDIDTPAATRSDTRLFYLRMHSLSHRQLLQTLGMALGRAKASDRPEQEQGITLRPPITVEEARQRGQLILVAEDNKTNVKVILHQLGLLGYAAEVANDGREALERWRGGGFALLLTDCHMPEMDGYDLARAIRAEEPEGTRMPIIAITADALKGTQGLCLDAGMDDYLTKPTQMETLYQKLSHWLPIEEKESGAQPTTQTPGQAGEAGVVDPGILAEAIGSDDPALLIDFYQDFLTTLDETLAEIEQTYTASDWPTLGGLAHRLKSSANTTGASQLGELCLAVEMAGKANGGDAVKARMEPLRIQAAAVRSWIREYITHAQGESRMDWDI